MTDKCTTDKCTADKCPTDNNKLQEDEFSWTIINSYFDNKHLKQLVKHQIESYNYFINSQLQDTINMFNPLVITSEQFYNRDKRLNTLEVVIKFDNLSIHRPQLHENNGATRLMFPQDARLRNFTYSSNLLIDLDIEYIVREGDNCDNVRKINKRIPNIHIGKIPVMLKSDICILTQYSHLDSTITGECKMDPGGYFIINGSEKTCIAQERAAENQVYCFNVEKNSTKWSWEAQYKAVPDWKYISPKQMSIKISSKNNGFGHPIYLEIPRLKNPIPLFIVFRAYGIISDRAICEKIILDCESQDLKEMLASLKASIVDANNYLTQCEAIKYIIGSVVYTPLSNDRENNIKRKHDFATEVLKNDIFPNAYNETQKVYMIGYMTNMLLKTSFGWIKETDRDNYINKRIDLTGVLLNNLFRNYFNKLVKDMQKQIVKEINNGSWRSSEDYQGIINLTNIYKIVKSTTIENGIKRALSTGDFGIKQINSNKVGVAQVLNRLTYIASLSHLRRINTPIDKSGKLIPPRRLHNSTWGLICPAETPEGAPIGIVKNLSYMTHVTIRAYSKPLYEYIKRLSKPLDECSQNELIRSVKVFVNGLWIAVTDAPIELYDDLKVKKLSGMINIYTSIVFNYAGQEIRICNSAGRLCRPLLRVKDNQLLFDNQLMSKMKTGVIGWNDLLTNINIPDAIIEYVDSYEQNNSLIAMSYKRLMESNVSGSGSEFHIHKYTHCEIHPSTIFGILAMCIPFPEHNQSPRNTYQSAMGKQAMGVYVTNYNNRMDKTAYVLNYPMRPLVETRFMNIIQLNQIPSGEMVIVAIMTHTGFNQEDSILFNKGSIDRGLFQATIYHTEKDEDKKLSGDQEIRGRPDKTKTKGMKFANYDKINKDGVIPEDTFIKDRDVIISKMLPIKENKNDFTKVIKYEDDSKIYKTNDEQTYIDKNLIDKNGDGYNFCKVKVRTLRKPVIGDKFSSRHGQKGTIGNIIPEDDMPFTESGLRPDIIINPHAIPSRMTIAQLKETVLGKVLLYLGYFGDGTSFGDFEVKDICSRLQEVGYESNSNELLYNGMTGEQLESSIFIGPAFYQRLKHMVNDKQHSRSIGPMVNLTRQPAEGRSKDGGLRFGEMERDCMVSHGASRFTKERLYDASDSFSVHICNKCGLIAPYNDKLNIHMCRVCDNRTDFKYVEIPYACKLLFQELTTMNIAPRIFAE
jgi:DNA-directed RNA polymerase II subunit RPB2